MEDPAEDRTEKYIPFDRELLRAKRARYQRHPRTSPAGEQIYAASIAPTGPTGSTALVAPTVAGVQGAAETAGLNVAALMGYYDDNQNLNYVGLGTPSTNFHGYQLFAEGQDAFYAAFFGRSLTMRLVALHGLAINGWGLGWVNPPAPLPQWGSGADRTFLQVWVPQPYYPAGVVPLLQEIRFGASYDDFVEQWVSEQKQKPSRHLDLIVAYTQADSDCYLGVFSPGTTTFTDFLATTDWNTFVARQNANASYALSDFKVYDRAGTRQYVGVWNGPSVAGTQFQFGDDLSTLNSFLAPLSLGSDAMDTYRYLPRWAGLPWMQEIPASVANRNPPPSTMGYAWAVGLGGSIVESGTGGLARNAFELVNPDQPFTIDSRIFLWSLTKLVATATLLYVLWGLDPKLAKLDQPFLPDILPLMPAGFSPQPEASQVTIRQLLTYTSGLCKNISPPSSTPVDPSDPAFDYAAWTAWLLEQPFDFAPGTAPEYANDDFDLAAFLIGVYSGQPPAQYILNSFLPRLGVDTQGLNYTADPDTDALQYHNASDTVTGLSIPPGGVIGGAGLIGSVRQYLNFLMGLRSAAFPGPLLQLMLCGNSGPGQPEGPNGGSLAWEIAIGPNGEFCQKDGGGGIWHNGLQQGASHGAFHFPGGFDAVMLTNSNTGDGLNPIWDAYDDA